MSATETASADVKPEITIEKSDAIGAVPPDAATPAEKPAETKSNPTRRISRFVVLALAMTVAAAAGSVAGAMAGAALVRPTLETPANESVLKDTIATLSAEISDLKASLEASSKSSKAQLAKMSERLERAEKAQAEPAAKLAKLSDAVERLEKKSEDVTGSIVAKQQPKAPVLPGWALREVYNGYALVESRYGIFEVGPGSRLPGVGRVETIRREDGRWVVVTAKGLIASR